MERLRAVFRPRGERPFAQGEELQWATLGIRDRLVRVNRRPRAARQTAESRSMAVCSNAFLDCSGGIVIRSYGVWLQAKAMLPARATLCERA